MTPEKWDEIKTNIERQFGIEDEGVEDLIVETADGPVQQGEAEFVVFQSPLGKTKLQLQEKPKLIDKKYHYSHQAGQAAQVEYEFSEDELVYSLKAYKWDDLDDEWKEIDSSSFNS